jgi:hypothetical protein
LCLVLPVCLFSLFTLGALVPSFLFPRPKAL